MKASGIEGGLRRVLSPEHAEGLDCSEALYRYAAGETSAAELQAFRAHLQSCAACCADVKQFELVATLPVAKKRSSRLWDFVQPTWTRGLVTAAACVGVVFFLWGRAVPTRTTPESPTILQAKGGVGLHVAVVRDGRTMHWAAIDSLAPGDDLRFSYSSPSPTYPALFGADETGTVQRLFPLHDPILRDAGDGVLGSAQVDSLPGCQWLVACFWGADQTPSWDGIAATLRDAVARRQGNDCELAPIAVPGAQVDVKAKRVVAR